MTSPDTSAGPPTPPPARTRPRLRAGLVLLLVGLAGIAIGIALDRAVLRSRIRTLLADDRLPPPRPGHFRRDLLGRLDRRLELSDSQRVVVDSILSRREAEVRTLLRESRPRFEAIAERTRNEIRQVLTPEQLERFKELEERRELFGRQKYRRRH